MSRLAYLNDLSQKITFREANSLGLKSVDVLDGALTLLKIIPEHPRHADGLNILLQAALRQVQADVQRLTPEEHGQISKVSVREMAKLTRASLPDVATAHTGAGEGSHPSNPQGKNRGRS